MKLDGEAVCHRSMLPSGPPKIVVYDDKALESEVLKESNEGGRKGKQEITSVLEERNYEKTDFRTSRRSDRDEQGYHNHDENEYSASGVNEGGNATSSNVDPTKEQPWPDNEAAIYTDKAITDVELPGLMDCFKEFVIKDICIDEGASSLDSVLVGNGGVDDQRYISILQSELDEYGSLTSSADVCAPMVSNDLKPSFGGTQLHSSDEKEVSRVGKTDNIQVEVGGYVEATNLASDLSDENALPKGSQFAWESDVGNQHTVSSSFDRLGCLEHPEQKHVCGAMDSVEVRPGNSADGANLATSIAPSAPEETSHRKEDEDLNSKPKSGNVSNNFDPSSQMNVRVEGAENACCQQSVWNGNASLLEDDALDSLTGSTRSFFIQHGLEESNHSRVGSVSGPLGSISFRSDSSTTSTRSFAFPILHSEWNSSPVKMAKADRGHFRKHRGWRMALLCCRF